MSIINPYNSESKLGTGNNQNQVKDNKQSQTIQNNSTNEINTNAQSANNNSPLNQEDFFALLTQQLTMQDPFKPVSNDQMIAQMASFSTVDGISKLNDEIVNLNTVMTSSQALQASTLIGQKVLVPSPEAFISEEELAIKGVVTINTPSDEVNIRIENEKGEVIDTFDIDANQIGNNEFTWNGINSNGETVPPGNYVVKATGSYEDENFELSVATFAHVTSVSLGSPQSGSVLNLRGMGGISLSDVLAISEG